MKAVIIDKNFEGLVDNGDSFSLDTTFKTESYIHVILDKPLVLTNAVKVGGEVRVKDSLKVFGSLNTRCRLIVNKDLEVLGDVTAGSFIKIGGNLTLEGEITSKGFTVKGNVYNTFS